MKLREAFPLSRLWSISVTAWDFLKDLNAVCSFMSREGAGKATNLELKRWLQR